MHKDRPMKLKRSLPRRLLRILGRTLLTIFIILVLIFFLVQTPFVQNIARGKAENYLSRKLNTRVRIGGLDIGFFHSVKLTNVYLEDRKKDTLLSAGLIDVRVRMMELLHHHLDIGLIHLQDVTAKIRKDLPDSAFNFQFIVDAFAGPPSSAPAKPGQPMKIDVKELDLDRVRFVYRDTVTASDMAVWIGHSVTKVNGIDLDRMRFDISHLDVEAVAAQMAQGNRTATDIRIGRLVTTGGKLDLTKTIYEAKDVQIDSTDFAYNDKGQKRQRNGVDYAHLGVTRFRLRGGDLRYTADSVSGAISSASMTEQSGFQLNQLHTRFYYSDHRTILDSLLVATPGTLLQRSVSLRYDSVGGIIKDAAHTLVDLNMAGSRVQVKDILAFSPSLRSQPLFSHPDEIWLITARAKGTFDDLTVNTLQISGLRDIRADLSGRIVHPFDVQRLHGEMRIRELSGSRDAVAALLPKGSMPSSVNLPAQFDITGLVSGSQNDVSSDLVLRTSSGDVTVRGHAQDFRSTDKAIYDLNLRTRTLQVGQILRDTTQWGAVTATLKIKGQGLDWRKAAATFSGRLDAATIRHYQYTGLTFDGSIADQQAQLRSAVNDPAVRFNLAASADLARKYPAVQLDWQIDTVDLRGLHLTTDTLEFKGHILADFASTNPDSLQGRLSVGGIQMTKGTYKVNTDSILLIAANTAGSEHLQLHSEMADLDMNGHYLLTQVPTALEHTINQYYQLSGFKDTAFTAQDWTLRIQLRTSPLVLALAPSLRGSDTVGGVMTFNSEHNNLQFGLQAPRIVAGNEYFHHVAIAVGTADSALHYDIALADGHGSGLLLYKTAVYGDIKDNRLTTSLLAKDVHNKDRYRIAGTVEPKNGAIKFSCNPDSLLLNYERWVVSRDNYIQYDSTGVLAHDFTISNQGDSLSLNSAGSNGAAPLDVRFANFRLSTISRLANQDSVIADGLLNGNAEVKNVMTKPLFTSDLLVQQLSVRSDTLGDLSVKVNNEKANAYTANIGLQGKNNDISIGGDYYPDSSRMDFKLDLRRINLAAFAGAVKGVVDSMRGSLLGQVTIRGTFDKPIVRGNLYFDSAVVAPTLSGEPLNVSHDFVAFDEDGFNFSEFTLRDSAGNKLVLDGNVYTKDYKKFGFDLSLNAQNFRMVNTPESSSRQFYGQLNLDAGINLEGTMDAPAVDGDIRVNKNTNFFYVLPENNPEVGDRVGVVRFVDHQTGDTLIDRKAIALRARQTQIKGMDLSLNLLTDTAAVLNMVIDPRSGDAVNVRGRSTLVFQMEKSGKMDLTGSYEVTGGYYTVSFEVIKRKFSIEPGSNVTWTGNPTSANVNLSAAYTSLTPSIDLVSNVISDLPQLDRNKFQQKLPFLVTLNLQGDMLKPSITFDISLPTSTLTLWPEVDQRLTELRNQPSEMNEQVFALLLLGRFVGRDPLASQAGGGSTPANLAFSTASQILTNQMNQASASLIKVVDVNFNLNNQQDWSTLHEIDYTELDVTVSKALMDERLRLSVGSSFDVIGTGAPQQAPSNLAGTLGANYKLTKDGRYQVRVYRQNQYEAVILGQVIETGVGFILTFNYDKFSEIWHRAKGDTIQERKTQKSSTTTTSTTTK